MRNCRLETDLAMAVSKLVGGLEHVLFSPIVGMMIQSDELIFFRGVGIPPTRRCSPTYLGEFLDPMMDPYGWSK